MNTDMNDMLRTWKSGKQNLSQPLHLDTLVKDADRKRKASRSFHYGNILVLAATVGGLLAFFRWLAPLRESLSQAGIAMMIGSLLIRILLEFYSAQKTGAISYVANAVDSTRRIIDFYMFRKALHGWVTVSIVVVYCVGLGLLTPEFYQYLGWLIFLFDGLFLLSGVFIILQVRKSIRREMNDLQALIEVKAQLQEH